MSIASVVLDYTKTRLTVEEIIDIAEVGYETVITFLCQRDGIPRPRWIDATFTTKRKFTNGVRRIANDLTRTPLQMHELWRAKMKSQGWLYSPTFDLAKKHHPQLLSYPFLPLRLQQQDKLLHNVIHTLIEFHTH